MLGQNKAGNVSLNFECGIMQLTQRHMRVAGAVLLLVSPWLMVQVWILAAAPDEPYETMPSCPVNVSNCAHVGQEMYRMDGTYEVVVNHTMAEITQALSDYIEDVNGDVLVEQTDENGVSLTHFVERTVFWRFPDDVAVRIVPLEDGLSCSIELHSQSRVGGVDMGVNPDRLDGLYSALTA